MSLRPRTACRDRGAARGQARRRRGRLDLGRVVHAAAADAGRPWGAQIQSVSRVLPCRTWHAFFIRPETLLRWHRRLIARRWTYPHRRPGRPPLDKEVRELILRLAQENGHWGYVRIVGELRKLGISVSATLVRNVLARAGIPPSPERAGPSWRSFLREHAEAVLACDFFTFETVWLRRLYVLFFVSIGTRRVEYLACTSSPDAGWLSKHANVLMDLDDRGQRVRFLIHDGTRSSAACLTAPSRARASGSSARRSGRRTRTPTRSAGSAACAGGLDRLLIVGRRRLEHVLRVYAGHFNQQRPHRALDLRPPEANIAPDPPPTAPLRPQRLRRRDLLGGAIHEYELAA
jgi:putative transposase